VACPRPIVCRPGENHPWLSHRLYRTIGSPRSSRAIEAYMIGGLGLSVCPIPNSGPKLLRNSGRYRFENNTTTILLKSSMDQSSPPNYKELFERETKLRRQAEEERRQAEEERRQAEEERRQAEEGRRQAEKQNRQFTRKTSLLEYLRTCHNLLSRPLRVRTPSRSTKGKIPAPQGKYCPARLLPWTDCADA